MNPFNMLINYVIASSRASFYNIPGNQEVTNTGLLAGMISDNPLLSYVLIDNKAKIEGEHITSSAHLITDSDKKPIPDDSKNDQDAIGNVTSGGGADVKEFKDLKANVKKNQETLVTVKDALKTLKEDFDKNIPKELKTDLKKLEDNNTIIMTSITTIEKRLGIILDGDQGTKEPVKPIQSQSKTNPK